MICIPQSLRSTRSRQLRRKLLHLTAVPVLIGFSAIGAHAQKTYLYDSLVEDWFSSGDPLVAASSGRLQVVRPPSNCIFVNATGEQVYFPTPEAGDWGGANWTAPAGEVVTGVSMSGDFRRETLDEEDFGAGVYGASEENKKDEKKIRFVTGSAEANDDAKWNAATKKMTYDWAVEVDPKDAITHLQFRAWEAIAGTRKVQAGSPPNGYSGNITHIEITTSPNASTAGTKAAVVPVETIELGNSKVRMRLSTRGELLSLEDLTTGTQLVVPDAAKDAWRIDWRGAPKGSEDLSVSEGFVSEDGAKSMPSASEYGSISSRRYDAPQVEKKANAVTFTWKKETLPTVVGTVTFDEAKEQFHFTVNVDNKSSAIVDSVSFPPTLSFDAKKENYTVVAADNAYNTSLKPLDTLKPFTTMYPGYLFMQMAGFKIGDSSLLIYTDDDKANVKWMKFTKDPDAAVFDLGQQIRLKPKNAWDAQYSVVFKVIPHGTYSEFAKTYGEWGRQQWWAKEKLVEKMAKRPMLNRYFEGGLVRMNAGPPVCDTSSFKQAEDTRWHYIENNKWSKLEPFYDNIIESITAYEKAYDFQPGYWHGVWSGQQFDSIYPDYFPTTKYMGDFDKFKSDLIEHGYPMMYHMNTAQWSETAETTVKEGKKYLALTDKGTPYRVYFQWSKMWSTLPSPAVALEVEMKTVKRIADKEGVNGIYLDVIGHAYATDENPLSPYHGKPNDYQLQKMLSFKTIRDGFTGPLMTEARNEIELAYMDMGTGGNGSPEEDEVPLWQMVYGDCTAITTYAVKDKRLRYYTWMLGGVNATVWDWPSFEGKRIPIYLTAAQQKVVSAMIPELLEQFDHLGDSRLSQWKSGFVLWNKAKAGNPSNVKHDTRLGLLEVKQLAPGGIVIWNAKGEFSVDSAEEVKLDGATVFRATVPLSINRAGGRWVVHNEAETPVEGIVQVPATAMGQDPLIGKFVTSGESVTVTPKLEGDFVTLAIKLPAGEALVLGKSEKK